MPGKQQTTHTCGATNSVTGGTIDPPIHLIHAAIHTDTNPEHSQPPELTFSDVIKTAMIRHIWPKTTQSVMTDYSGDARERARACKEGITRFSETAVLVLGSLHRSQRPRLPAARAATRLVSPTGTRAESSKPEPFDRIRRGPEGIKTGFWRYPAQEL